MGLPDWFFTFMFFIFWHFALCSEIFLPHGLPSHWLCLWQWSSSLIYPGKKLLFLFIPILFRSFWCCTLIFLHSYFYYACLKSSVYFRNFILLGVHYVRLSSFQDLWGPSGSSFAFGAQIWGFRMLSSGSFPNDGRRLILYSRGAMCAPGRCFLFPALLASYLEFLGSHTHTHTHSWEWCWPYPRRLMTPWLRLFLGWAVSDLYRRARFSFFWDSASGAWRDLSTLDFSLGMSTHLQGPQQTLVQRSRYIRE